MLQRLRRWGLSLLFFLGILPLLFIAPKSKAELSFYFFDVGQGDATLIRTPDGCILVDAGPDAAEEELLLRLEQLGVHRLRLLILTHADEDHIGGADGVLRELCVDEVWMGADDEFGEPFLRLTEELKRKDLWFRTPMSGDVLSVAGAELQILAPVPFSGMVGNNGSIVFRFVYREISALFMGDAEGELESLIYPAFYQQLKSDIYKVPHHGSATDGNNRMLSAVRPTYAVISCGKGNSYGHPHGGTLSVLRSVGASIYRTDLDGEIRITFDGTELKVAP